MYCFILCTVRRFPPPPFQKFQEYPVLRMKQSILSLPLVSLSPCLASWSTCMNPLTEQNSETSPGSSLLCRNSSICLFQTANKSPTVSSPNHLLCLQPPKSPFNSFHALYCESISSFAAKNKAM